MSLVQLLLRPSPWVDFFWFSRGSCHLGPRMPQNPCKNKKKQKKQKDSVQFLLRPSPWVDFFLFAREYPKTHGKTKKNTPCHLSSFSSDPLHGSIFFVFVFVFSRFLPRWPKNAPKPMEKPKKKFPQTLSMGRNFLFLFFFRFSRGFLPLCQSNNVSCSFFVFFVFLFFWVPGRNFHPDKHPLAQLSLVHILYWCLH